MNSTVREYLKDFLLQRMCEAESDLVTQRTEENAVSAETLDRAENELIDDFLDSNLSGEENELFRLRFLKTDALLNKSLKRVGDRHQAELESDLIKK